MRKYAVTVRIIKNLEKPINVFAADEAEAEEKALDIVLVWDNVDDAEAIEIEEV